MFFHVNYTLKNIYKSSFKRIPQHPKLLFLFSFPSLFEIIYISLEPLIYFFIINRVI